MTGDANLNGKLTVTLFPGGKCEGTAVSGQKYETTFSEATSPQVFNTSNCSNPVPSVSGPPSATVPQSLIELILQFKVANPPESPNVVAAPPCSQQGPFTFNGQTSQFPHVVYGGK